MATKKHHVAPDARQYTEAELSAHLSIARYGDFLLTDAIRPMPGPSIVPVEGYRRDCWTDPESGEHTPCVIASVSREKLFDLFLELVDLLGGPDTEVGLCLETSHGIRQDSDRPHVDLKRDEIELCVAKSHLVEYEDVLLDDGCAGVALYSAGDPEVWREVQLDEHKLLVMYAKDVVPFEDVLDRAGVKYRAGMEFITQATHAHQTDPRLIARFVKMAEIIGAGQG